MQRKRLRAHGRCEWFGHVSLNYVDNHSLIVPRRSRNCKPPWPNGSKVTLNSGFFVVGTTNPCVAIIIADPKSKGAYQTSALRVQHCRFAASEVRESGFIARTTSMYVVVPYRLYFAVLIV